MNRPPPPPLPPKMPPPPPPFKVGDIAYVRVRLVSEGLLFGGDGGFSCQPLGDDGEPVNQGVLVSIRTNELIRPSFLLTGK